MHAHRGARPRQVAISPSHPTALGAASPDRLGSRLAWLLAAAVTFGAAPARAEPPSSGELVQKLGIGEIVDRVDRPPLAYLALRDGGVLVVDLDATPGPRVLRRIADGERIDQLLVRGDALFLLKTIHEATVYDLRDPRDPRISRGTLPSVAEPPARTPAEPVAPGAAPRDEPLELEVLAVRDGRAILRSSTTSAALRPGARVAITSHRMVEKPSLLRGGMELLPSNEVTAVLEIEHVDGDRAMAELGRGDVAMPGDRATLTDRPLSERLMFPSRAPFDVRLGFHARPFLGLESNAGSKPVGFLVDLLAALYLRPVPLVLELTAEPLGLTIGGRDAHHPITLAGTAAYTTDYFEIGLGAGALIAQDGPCFGFIPPSGGPPTIESCEENTGFTINQKLRLGALDGFSLTWRSSVFSRPDRFVFGVGRGEVAVPVTRRLSLFGAGGGGENGWGFGEFGVRTYLGGAGARGTTIISASLGYAGIFDGPSDESVAGPAVAFGMEWRL